MLSPLYAWLSAEPPPGSTASARQLRRIAGLLSTLVRPPRQGNQVLLRGLPLIEADGPLTLCDNAGRWSALAALFRREPVALLAAGSSVRHFAHRLGLQPADCLQALLSPNDLVVFFGTKSGVPAVVHVATRPYRDELLLRHARHLRHLADLSLPPRTRATIADLLGVGNLDGRVVLLQSRLAGRRLNLKAYRFEQALAYIDRAIDWLATLPATPAAEPPDAQLRARLHALPEALPRYGDAIAGALARLDRWFATLGCPSVPVHGDFGFHNLLFNDQGALCGVIDWDRMRPAGTPHYDALHLLMTAMGECRICSADQFIMAMWLPDRRTELFRAGLEHLLARLGCTESYLRHMTLMLWLALILHGCIETPPPNPQWQERVIGQPAAVLAAAVWPANN